jgi:hypothetical protein
MGFLSKIVEINEKYKKPRIRMTPFVSVSLFFLRFYLLFLVAILFFKFWTLVKK